MRLHYLSACGDIFNNANMDHMGSYASYISSRNAFQAELIGVMFVVEFSSQ